MTYAIGEIWFGINLKNYTDLDISDTVRDDIGLLSDRDVLGSSYSGSGDQPLFLAVSLDDIDECNDLSWSEIESLKNTMKTAMEPGSAQRAEYLTLLQDILDDVEISDETKEWFKAQEPEAFLTWGSS